MFYLANVLDITLKSKIMYSKIILFILLPIIAFSQAPQKINFQSILRNTNGEVVSNKLVSLKISILSGSISGLTVYSETHTKTTDISGLISLQIGNGTVLSGVFANIGWGNAPHFIKLEVDFSGGSNFVLLGTQELMSVPYALYASKTDTSSLNLVNRFSTKLNGTDTATLSNRIDTKSSLSDTSLLNLTSRFSTKLNVTDTASLSNRIDTKLNKTDTSLLNLANRFSSKVNLSDTSDMLSNYKTGLNSKVNISDTSTMLTNYRTGLNSKVNIADTSNMLNPYLRKESIQNSTLELFGIHSWEYPEGFSKEFVIISDDNLPYTVPSGKNLYTFPQAFNPIVDNIFYPNGSGSFSFLFKEGTIITNMERGNYNLNMAFGFLVKKTNTIIPVNFVINSTNLTFTVPTGKILFIKSGPSIVINSASAVFFMSGFGIPIMDGSTIKVNSLLEGATSKGVTGYLLDK